VFLPIQINDFDDRRIRIFAINLFFSVFCISLVACGGGGGGSASPPPVNNPPPSSGTIGSLYSDATANLPNGLPGRCMDADAKDVDGDNDLDLILAFEFGRNVILLNDGNANFTVSDSFTSILRDSEDLTVNDFDNDGDLDVLFVTEDDLINEFYLNNGDGSFTDESNRIPVEGISNAVVAFDVNNDSLTDIIIGNNGPNVLLLNTGGANFLDDSANSNFGAGVTQDLEVGDLDNDGDLDLVVGNETQNLVFINNNDGTFSDESTVRFPGVLAETRDLELGDIDNDGDLDILVSNVTFFSTFLNGNYMLINDGNGVFTRDANFSMTGNHVDSDFVDLDRDGDLDIISGTAELSGGIGAVQVLENDGSGVFTGESFGGQGNVFDITAADFNGDNKVDLHFCNRQTGDGGGQDLLYLAN